VSVNIFLSEPFDLLWIRDSGQASSTSPMHPMSSNGSLLLKPSEQLMPARPHRPRQPDPWRLGGQLDLGRPWVHCNGKFKGHFSFAILSTAHRLMSDQGSTAD